MSVSKQIDVLAMYYLASHQALQFISGWLTYFYYLDLDIIFIATLPLIDKLFRKNRRHVGFSFCN